MGVQNSNEFARDFPVGPVPGQIRNFTKRVIDKRKDDVGQNYSGSKNLKLAIGEWLLKRFHVNTDFEREILSIGNIDQALFSLALGFLSPGDKISLINPNTYVAPSFATIGVKTKFIDASPYDNFIPELVNTSKILVLNYPNNPTTIASKEILKEAADLAMDENVIIINDESFSEIYYDEKPHSLLEYASENVIVYNTPGYRSNMLSYNVGFIAGDSRIITHLKYMRKSIGDYTPIFMEDACICAYSDEEHARKNRETYKRKRDIICKALNSAGLLDCKPNATPFIFQKCNDEVSKKLSETGLITIPFLDNYSRISLGMGFYDCKKISEQIKEIQVL